MSRKQKSMKPAAKVSAKPTDDERSVGAKLQGEWKEAFDELESTGLSQTALIRQGIVRLLSELRAQGFIKSEMLPQKLGVAA